MHGSLYDYMEKERIRYNKMGIKVSSVNITKMIAENLNKKRRGFGILNDKTKRKTR